MTDSPSHPDPFIAALLRAWARSGDYVARLVADLSDADMVSQPVPGVTMNHPAWVLSHLSLYPPVMTAMLTGRPFTDPKESRFWAGSAPSSDAAQYAPKARLVGDYLAMRDELTRTLASAPAAALTARTPLERWVPRFPVIADVLVHLMTEHESQHLGQLSAWRRAGRRASV